MSFFIFYSDIVMVTEVAVQSATGAAEAMVEGSGAETDGVDGVDE